MKQTLFMVAMEVVAVVGVFLGGPVIPVAVYYFFSVLRPQYLWIWALPEGVQWSDPPSMAAIAGVVVQGLGLLSLGKRYRFPGFASTHFLFFAFGCWVCISYFTAQDAITAWPWLLEYLTIFTMFIVAIFAIRTLEHVWLLYLCATVPLMYVGYTVNSLYFFDGRLDIYHNGLGGLDNNGAGLTLAMGVPLALGAWEATRRWWRWVFLFTIPLQLHAVLVSYSRGAMVSLIAVTPFLILRSRRKLQFGVATALLACTIPFLAGQEIRARFFTVSEYAEDESANQRFESWAAAVRIANDYPIFGVGIRNANLFSFKYGADMQGRTIHSQFLQILADEGYVGFTFYALTLATYFLNGWRLRRFLKKTKDPRADDVGAMLNGMESALITFCVGGLFLSLEVFELPYLLLLLGTQLFLIARIEFASAPEAPQTVQPGMLRVPVPVPRAS